MQSIPVEINSKVENHYFNFKIFKIKLKKENDHFTNTSEFLFNLKSFTQKR